MSAPVVSVRNLRKSFRDVGSRRNIDALVDVSFDVHEHGIHGLLGRNGAGKTTLLQILTGQQWADDGEVSVFGGSPFENATVLRDVCFVKESQRYPDDFRVSQVLDAASAILPRWDEALARDLMADFDLPRRRKVKKLSRGMTSALGVVVGLASRAPLTLFDEPYLGLDAVSRQLFYDRLLADYAEHPRTVVLSTHLIDEVADLVDRVVVVDGGRVVVDDDAEQLRGRAVTVSGNADGVADFTIEHTVLQHESMGSMARTTIDGPLSPESLAAARAAGLHVDSVSLQQFVVASTTRRKVSS